MSKSDPMALAKFRFALADSIAFLNPDHWDSVAAVPDCSSRVRSFGFWNNTSPATYPRTMPSFMQVTGLLLPWLSRALRFGLRTYPPGACPKWAVFMLSLKDLLEKGKGHPYPKDIQINHD